MITQLSAAKRLWHFALAELFLLAGMLLLHSVLLKWDPSWAGPLWFMYSLRLWTPLTEFVLSLLLLWLGRKIMLTQARLGWQPYPVLRDLLRGKKGGRPGEGKAATSPPDGLLQASGEIAVNDIALCAWLASPKTRWALGMFIGCGLAVFASAVISVESLGIYAFGGMLALGGVCLFAGLILGALGVMDSL